MYTVSVKFYLLLSQLCYSSMINQFDIIVYNYYT